MKIYLSGNMTPSQDVYYQWVENFTRKMIMHDSIHTFSYAKQNNASHKQIIRHDLARLNNCDIVVFNMGVTDQSHHFTGCVVEIYEAYKNGKPIYAFTSQGLITSTQVLSPWMDYFITTKFDSEEDLIHHLLFDENLK